MTKIRSVRGMNDWHQQDASLIIDIAQLAERLFSQAGFEKVILPVIESTHLFARAVGEATDIVEKEMYSFTDRNDELLSLRPEGTAGLVRALIEKNWRQSGEIKRFQYFGPMFRRERPQKGRYRQFHQFGAETFGDTNPYIDAELIALSYRWFTELQLIDNIQLHINSIGKQNERENYRKALIDYLTPLSNQLDLDSLRRLKTNPLRILDSKSETTQALLEQAPKLSNFLGEDSQSHFTQVQKFLQQLNIPYQINVNLVRGLDYYNDTVFEWATELLGAQGTVCGGGRYDQLSTQLGGRDCPACGFAAGIERIIQLYKHIHPNTLPTADIYIISEQNLAPHALDIAQQLRQSLPLIIQSDVQFASFKSQFKRADKSGANYAIILATNEWAENKLILKPLRKHQPQQTLTINSIIKLLSKQNN